MTLLNVPFTNPMSDVQLTEILDRMWPEGVVRPVQIDVLRDTWTWVQRDSNLLGPLIFMRMPNKAEMAIEHLDEQGIRSGWHEFRGDWDSYIKGVPAIKSAIGNSLYEIFILAIASDSRGIRIN